MVSVIWLGRGLLKILGQLREGMISRVRAFAFYSSFLFRFAFISGLHDPLSDGIMLRYGGN